MGPAFHGEPHWSYLNRSGREQFAMARDRINDWFSHLCRDLQTGVRQRLQSDDDQEFVSAFWELFLHETFIRLGYTVTCEPVLPSGRKIDFLVAREESSMFVEATIAHSSVGERAAGARRNRVYRGLQKVNTNAFMLGVEIERAAPRDLPNIGQLRTTLEAWLAGLDPDAVLAAQAASGAFPALPWEADGWSMIFEAYPLKPEHRGSRVERPLGSFMDETGGAIDDETPLRRALNRKAASRYGTLDRPYVVAVCEYSFAHGDSDWHRNNVLFGHQAVAFGDGRPPRSVRRPDGHWRGPGQRPRNRRLSAVLLCNHLYPWNLKRAELECWENPFAERPVPADLVPGIARWRKLKLRDNEGTFVVIEPSLSADALFGTLS